MDIINKSCQIAVQNNFVFQSTSTPLVDNQDYHLTKTVKSFIGRDVELDQLTSWLFGDMKNTKKMAVICGLPGYGKTELARRFAHSCKERELVRSVLWLDAETLGDLEQSFRELLRCLGASDKAELDVRSVVEYVNRHFSPGPHLFVLDNALDRRHVLGFEPEGECRCVVTSHLEDWGDDVPALKLAPLSLDAAVDVLRAELQHRFQDKDLEEYKHLAELLSRVPLALQVAAAYVRQEVDDLQEDFHLCDYVDRLQAPSTEVIDQPLPGSNANTYDKTFLQAIQISLNKIRNASDYDSNLATDVLYICAYLNPEQIFYTTLLEISCVKKVLKLKQNSRIHLKKACALLRKYSFISVQDEKITIHRLIQNVICHISKYQIYFDCLEILLDDSNNSKFHSQFILKLAEHRLEIFNEFYIKYKSEILEKNVFFRHIINSNCKIFFKTILDGLGAGAADVINARCLLQCAVKSQQHDILELLLKNYEPNVDERDGNKNTALMCAARELDLRAMKTLALYKANMNAIDAYGNSVLHLVIRASGSAQNLGRSLEAVEAVRWLVGRGARTDAVGLYDASLVHAASQALSPDLVRCLVTEFKCDVNAVDIDMQTPLYYVDLSQIEDRRRQQDTVRCLLELGAHRDVKNKWGRTPAGNARERGITHLADFIENPSAEIQESEPVVYELRRAAARGDLMSLPRLLDELGERALQVANKSCLLYEAVLHSRFEVLEMLLGRGVDVNSRTTNNTTPLHQAAWELDMRAMELLVDYKADVNAVDVFGHSVLLYLVSGAREAKRAGRGDEACEALRWLVARGARTDAVSSLGHSLLHEASRALNPELIRCLVTEYSLDVNAVDMIGCTPLFWVSLGLYALLVEESRGLSTAACLLELGARAHVLNARGNTPARFARLRDQALLATFLDAAAALQVQGNECDWADMAAAVGEGVQEQEQDISYDWAVIAAALAALEDDVQVQAIERDEADVTAVEDDIQVQVQGSERNEVDITAVVATVEDDIQVQDMTWTWWQRICQFCCCKRHRYHNVPV